MTDPVLDMLLRDIVAHPDDDGPRLAFADRLEETGADDDRAEFIRAQCELPGLLCESHRDDTGHPDCRCRFCSLIRRERLLLAAHPAHPRWLGRPDPLPAHPKRYALASSPAIECVGAGRVECTFGRGFLVSVNVPAADWMAYGPALVRESPLCRVVLSDRRPELDDDGAWRWYGSPDPGMGGWGTLPLAIFSRLPPTRGLNVRAYPTSEAAASAASTAYLAWAVAQPAPAPVH